ncbi:hypothetical protein D8I35_10675 [Corticibacter populi]|uniref:Chorismate-utilising enzyme C-terminal domain-containing protein n=1 Tax=Corticibacter populi TaxID=1550736 RepID=A0A3M6QT55_9BURK|nr:bifunctional anthranilate synthase component I family protein/class IV aminotransferase [Corticibacter populi]RMX05652.1 hypothetical protein D8I35_10675 [Corticibacter populi]RZS31069.1 para-aminobenzoate synthetase/4-amino-4-deoxychorismate lyase [Corticibacter populi]
MTPPSAHTPPRTSGNALDVAPFALLDDGAAAAGERRSRLYTGWQRSLACHDAAGLQDWLQALRQALRQGLHAVLLADYEWGLGLQGLPPAPGQLRAELFSDLQMQTRAQVDAWLDRQLPADAQAGLLGWHASQDEAQFAADIAAIHAAIARGETYQVNHTFSLRGLAHGAPLALYRRLRQRQQAEFGALIHRPGQTDEDSGGHAGDGAWILSFSPELFLQVRGAHITARPMKGTAAASDDATATQAAADALRSQTKTRAENVMIVDLLRNDLGRVALPGTVRVPALFAVQRNGPVLGMTSTVEATLRPGTSLADVLRATFPCGSITGAPKHRTMQLIAQREGAVEAGGHRRGIYTGAIGWVDLAHGTAADDATDMDYCLSVPIRTLFLDDSADVPDGPGGPHRVRMPVGAGIVWDSQAAAEWQECWLKARFATQEMAGFELFETMRVAADGSIPLWPRHRARLLASAQALGFAAAPAGWDAALQDYQRQHLPTGQAWRLRLALREHGDCHFSHGVLAPLAQPGSPDDPVTAVLCDTLCGTTAWLRRHKTTLRSDYDAAMHAAQARGAFDGLFFNEAGQLTEGARSNVFVRLGGHWFTPPLQAGLLPGVMRAVLLEDPAWQARERTLHREDLLRASDIVLCNALRGALHARLLTP